MGKAKKEHRKKVAKRNEKVAQAKRSFQKKIDSLRAAFAEGMLKQNSITGLTEEQVANELVEEISISSRAVGELTETNIGSDEQSETKGE
jgi:hypothetical protein